VFLFSRVFSGLFSHLFSRLFLPVAPQEVEDPDSRSSGPAKRNRRGHHAHDAADDKLRPNPKSAEEVQRQQRQQKRHRTNRVGHKPCYEPVAFARLSQLPPAPGTSRVQLPARFKASVAAGRAAQAPPGPKGTCQSAQLPSLRRASFSPRPGNPAGTPAPLALLAPLSSTSPGPAAPDISPRVPA